MPPSRSSTSSIMPGCCPRSRRPAANLSRRQSSRWMTRCWSTLTSTIHALTSNALWRCAARRAYPWRLPSCRSRPGQTWRATLSCCARWCACVWSRQCHRSSFAFVCWCRKDPICSGCRDSATGLVRSMRICSAIRGATPIPAWTPCSTRCKPWPRKASNRDRRAAKYSSASGGAHTPRSASRRRRSPGLIVANRFRICPSPGTAAPNPPISNYKASERLTVKRVLLLLPNTSYRNDDFLAAAEKLDVDFIRVANYCHRLAPLCGMGPIQSVPFDQPEAALKQLRIALGRKPDAVLAVDDSGLDLAALLREYLGLPGNSPEAVRQTRDRLAFRRLLQSAGLRCPEFSHLDDDAQGATLPSPLRFPVVVKARRLSASRGVIRADTPQAYAQAVQWVRGIQAKADRDAAGLGLIVEEFIT